MSVPETRYASADGVSIAYQVVGEGERDLVLVLGLGQHLELQWESPHMAAFFRGLSSFCRLILFDKRGTGLSDRNVGTATLEERMGDVRAVMDAVGSETAVLMGVSEGAPMSVLFSATYPERASALVLFGGMARSTWAPDHPWAAPSEDLIASAIEFLGPYLHSGEDLEIWAPSLADDPVAKGWLGRYRRSAISPDGLLDLFQMFLEIDVRDVLHAIRAPTLVLHRRGDRVVNRRSGQWMADRIPGAQYVELGGSDHFPWTGDTGAVVEEVRQFLTGARGVPESDSVLLTVLFTDIVDSTVRTAELGDQRWKQLIEQHDALVREEVERHRGNLVKTTGDGVLATFDGPARAVRCAQRVGERVRVLGIDVRAGLHTGEVELVDSDVAGLAVAIGQRVSDLAGPGEVLVSSTVRDLVAGSRIAFEDRGQHTLKGVPGEWRLYAPVSSG